MNAYYNKLYMLNRSCVCADIPECAPSCEEDTLLNSEAQVTMLVLEEMVRQSLVPDATRFILWHKP